MERFTVIDLSNKGRLVADNPDLLGVVGSIESVNDSIVAICQNREDAHVTLYNLNTNRSQTAMTRGEGPDEMLRVSTMSSDYDGNLWLVGLMDQKVMKARWNDNDDKRASSQFVFKLPEDYLRGVTNFEGGIIGMPTTGVGSRLREIGPTGIETDSIGSYPKTSLPEDLIPTNVMFQSDMAFSPDKGMAAIACKSWNFIDIVDIEGDKSISLELPIDDPITLEKFEIGDAISYNPKPFWLMFSGADATPGSFYVGYIGVKVQSPEDMGEEISSILEFDWEGNPKRLFKFANDVVTFSVSHDGKMLYTVENNPDPMLYEYTLE